MQPHPFFQLCSVVRLQGELKLRIDETSRRFELWLSSHCLISFVQIAVDAMLWLSLTKGCGEFRMLILNFKMLRLTLVLTFTIDGNIQVSKL